MANSDDTIWAILAHLSYFLLPFIGPLIIYLIKKDQSPFVRAHAAQALNFHITLLIASIVSAILILLVIGIVMLIALGIAGVVFTILAAMAAGRGQPYRYPYTWNLVT